MKEKIMTPERELQILRAAVMMTIKNKGLRFDQNPRRVVANETKELSRLAAVDPPIRPSELLEVVTPLVERLTAVYLGDLRHIIAKEGE